MASGPSDDQQINIGAAVAGWIFPGLGQFILGHRRRGLLAMLGVMLLVVTGLLVGGLDCVDRDEDRLWFLGQACAGPVVVAASYANDLLIKSGHFGHLIDAPSNAPIGSAGTGPQISTFKGLAHPNEFGTLLIFFGGLMNLIVMLDALVRVPPEPAHDRRASESPTTQARGGA